MNLCQTPTLIPFNQRMSTTVQYPLACWLIGPSPATTRPKNPSMPWCMARSPKTVRDALPQAAESALRPLPDGRHRWPIRTTRCTAGCFCDLPATLQPAIDSLGIEPAEAAVILQNAFMQPAHTLPETACFGVPVMRPAGQGDSSVVKERHIAELPFYSFWRDSSIGSAKSLIDGQAAVFLHDWIAFCRLFIRTGKHRCQTGYTGNQAEDGQYSYFGLPIVHTPEQDNAPAISEADIAKLPFYTYWHTACASDVHRLADGTRVVPLADWEAFCQRLVLTGR